MSINLGHSPTGGSMRASFGLRRCGLASAASHATDSQDAYPNPKYRSITTYIMVAKRASTRMLFVIADFKTFTGTSAAAPSAAAIATIIRAACFPTVGVPPVHRLPRVDATRRGRLPLNGGIYFLVHFCTVQTTGLLSSVPASSEVSRFVDRGDRSLAVESRTRVSIVRT